MPNSLSSAESFTNYKYIELEMAGNSVDEKWSIDKLDGSNWTTWKFQMRHLLLAKGLWRHVDGTAVLAENANAQAQTKISESFLHYCVSYRYTTAIPGYVM